VIELDKASTSRLQTAINRPKGIRHLAEVYRLGCTKTQHTANLSSVSLVYCRIAEDCTTNMPKSRRQRSKLKTAVIQVRVEPHLKEAAEKAANLDHRTLTNWIEVLIIGRCKELRVDSPSSSPSAESV